jgi:hypothetical protein
VVPAGSDRVSRARPYSGTRQGRPYVFAYRAITLCGLAFHPVRLTHDFVTPRPAGRRIETSPTTLTQQRPPPVTSRKFGLFPFRSPLLRESRFLSFPLGTEMFQFPSLPPAGYGFTYGYRRITSGEFPHSEIPGSMTGQRLPRAFRSRPRPSSALGAKASTVCPCSLDQKNTGIDVAMEFSRCTRAPSPPYREMPSSHPVSQNSTACACEACCLPAGIVEVDVVLGEPDAGRPNDMAINGAGAYRPLVEPASLERR